MDGLPTVVVLVAAGASAEPTTLAVERATSAALGHAAQVVVREAMGAPTDGEALTIGSDTNEVAVVQVTWNDRGHRTATLRVYLARRGRWMDRTIGFSAADAAPERGRTIGLALASMLPDPDLTPAPRERPAPQETRPQPAAGALPATPDVSERVELYVAPDELQDRARVTHRSSTPRGPHYAMDFFGVGAAGLGSSVQTAGGGAAFEMFLMPWLAVRIGGAVRVGDIAATTRTLTLLGAAGVELHPWPAANSRVLSASLRVDYVLMQQTVTHDSAGSAELSTRSRRLSGLDALVEAQWRLGANFDVLTGVGLEEMLA